MTQELTGARFAPTSASVRDARRFTTGWARGEGHGDVADDAASVVSELAANAVLHARTDFEVHLGARDGGVRVEVRDGSATMPLSGSMGPGATSGRGLPLVHALAASWGVDPLEDGKRVWAQITPGADVLALDVTAEDLLEMWAGLGEDAKAVPAAPVGPLPAVAVVVVPDLPVEELLAAKVHMEDLVRELQLVLLHRPARGGRDGAPVLGLARRLDAAARELDSARLQIRSQALRAAEQGRDRVTLELSLPPDLVGAAVRYREAIEEAEALSRVEELLTHTEALSRYSGIRRLYLDQVIAQLAAARA